MANGVKQAGLGIRNPVETADILFAASKDACQVLTDSLVQGTVLNLAEHKASVCKASTEALKQRVLREKGIADARALEKGQREGYRLQRAVSAGIWLTCFPSRLHGTELSAEEFVDNVRFATICNHF
jgi:Arc/MetJ family transcription regulator